MSNVVKIKLEGFEVQPKNLTDVEIELPFGSFKCKIDFEDTTTSSRLAEFAEIYANREKYIQVPDGTEEQAKKALEVLSKIKYATDYIYNIEICNEIYKHIDPLATVVVKGEKTIFTVLLVKHIQEVINAQKLLKAKQSAKNNMKAFVNKHA